MSEERSLATGRRYGVRRVCSAWEIQRSTYYAREQASVAQAAPGPRRGPKTAYTDAALTEHIRRVLAASPFLGEGHRKVWARLRYAGIRVGKPRVLRLMGEACLLAPQRAGTARGPRAHDGTIIPERPDTMWGTDLTATLTRQEGQVSVFVCTDHFTGELLGVHAAKRATRWEALEPVRQAVRTVYGAIAEKIAAGLSLRHDHGSQYVSDDFQDEIDFLGIASSPAFVRAPEGNGCAERIIRTLKEQVLWVHQFENAEAVRRALVDWAKIYNTQWLIERHGHITPAQARARYYETPLAAAA